MKISPPIVRIVTFRPLTGQRSELLEILGVSVPKINSRFGAVRILCLSSEDEMAIVSMWARQEDLARMRSSDDYWQLLTSIKERTSRMSDAVYDVVADSAQQEPKSNRRSPKRG